MPCMCWFDPPEESKKKVKHHCQEIIEEIKRLNQIGDPIGLELKDVKELLDHLWNPNECNESKKIKWISVKDQLPEIPEGELQINCLIWIADQKRMKVAKYEKCLEKKGLTLESMRKLWLQSKKGKWRTANFQAKQVTHWMPLPEPPKN